MMLSAHLSLDEATRSEAAKRAGLSNNPDAATLEKMTLAAENIFEPCREFVAGPLYVSSFYRSPAVNRIVGGAANSQHQAGEAMDLNARTYGKSNAELFYHIAEEMDFDQLIYEFGSDIEPEWIHVSYKSSGNRKQILRSYHENGKTIYKKF